MLARRSKATVGPDIHIKVGRTFYSVPWKLIGRRVDVRSTAVTVQIFHEGALVKTHAALEQGERTDRGDCPPEKIAFQMRTPIRCRGQASQVGDACREVIDQLLEVNALYRLRAAQGGSGCGEVRRHTAGGRLPQGGRGRQPLLPHRRGHPGRRHQDRPGTRDRRCRSLGLPARARGPVRRHRPHPDARQCPRRRGSR
ncbi:Mu transposase domain-containing protein [Streptomyces sp. enrichment culture]|uniref:Mu transposase domain-containing protein n=1 Tax=Streptomyces sp. enrichment culture TaxID=1795815 RepID=UPI003F555D0F